MSRRAPLSLHVKVSVAWSPEDGEYVATTPAYPWLSGLGPEKRDALAALAEAIVAADAPEGAPR